MRSTEPLAIAGRATVASTRAPLRVGRQGLEP